MNFAGAEAYLLSLGNEVAAMKLGLESMRVLFKALGDPQDSYLKVQVAGTNGKGSVCAFLDSICRTAGVPAGVYTSPHLVSITERVRIDGELIGRDEFARLATHVRGISEGVVHSGDLPSVPTFFEQVTAIALLAFAAAKVEVAILETGLGGRLDATTAANAEICAITRIDLDHQEYLGDTIAQIAGEKAAIIHQGCKAFIGQQVPEATAVFRKWCADAGVRPVFADRVDVRQTGGGYVFSTDHDRYQVSTIGLKGLHQIENATLAILVGEELSQRFEITGPDIAVGIECGRHPGRIEHVGRYLFDGAHNPGGAAAMATYLDGSEFSSITLVFAAMEDKPVAEMLELLVPRVERIVFTEVLNERSLSYTDLLNAMPSAVNHERTFVTDAVHKAVDIAEAITPDDGIILVTGSLYLVGEVKKLLEQRSQI